MRPSRRRFETVARVSEINLGLYRTLLSPSCKPWRTPAIAEMLRDMHPNRVRFGLFSDQNPLMQPIASLAEACAPTAIRSSDDNPLVVLREDVRHGSSRTLRSRAKMREAMTEAMFLGAYGAPLLQAAVGLGCDHADADGANEHDLAPTPTRAELEADARRIDEGDSWRLAFARLSTCDGGGALDERQFNALEAIRGHAPKIERRSLSKLKSIRASAGCAAATEARAIAAIPRLLPDDRAKRATVLELDRRVVTRRAASLPDEGKRRLAQIEALFDAAHGRFPSLAMPQQANDMKPV